MKKYASCHLLTLLEFNKVIPLHGLKKTKIQKINKCCITYVSRKI